MLNSIVQVLQPLGGQFSLAAQISIALLWLGCVGAIAAGARRFYKADSEMTRKIVHIGAGNVILIAWGLALPAWVGIAASVLFSGVALLSYRFPLLPAINSIGRKSLGTFFYAVSIGVLIGCFWHHAPQFTVMGILVMTWGDGLAGLIGKHWGQHRYKLWGMQKSWEGSLTMMLVSYIVSSAILFNLQGNLWQTWVISLAIALITTGLEAFSKLGIDNLTVPIGSAMTGFLLTQILQ